MDTPTPSRLRRYAGMLAGVVLPVALVLAAAGAAEAAQGPAVWLWGFDSAGQVGNGTTLPGNTGVALPQQLHLPAGVALTTVSLGSDFAVGLDTSGRAWSWGDNAYGELGIGSIDIATEPTPHRVAQPRGVSFTTVAAGGDWVLAIDRDGRAWGWGNDDFGQLGDGGKAGRAAAPVRATQPAGVRFVAVAGGHDIFSVALDDAGDAWAWGDNAAGELGTGDTTAHEVPTRVAMPAGVHFTRIAAGGVGGPGGGAHVVALDRTGAVWSWGDNASGAVGDGTTTNAPAPVQVKTPPGVRFTAVSAGGNSSLALDTSGVMWGWGAAGNIGAGDQFDASRFGQGAGETHVPVRAAMPPGTRFTSIAAGANAGVALDRSGNAWAFGDNSLGELGNGTDPTASSLAPVAVRMPAGVHWTAVAAGPTANTFVGYVASSEATHIGGWSLSTIARSLQLPSQAIRPASSLAINGAIAAVAALFLTFPSSLFNSTLDENYAEISGWFTRRLRPFRRRPRADAAAAGAGGRSKRAFAGVLLVGALLNCLLDPAFGHNRSSVTTYVGVLLAMTFGMATATTVTTAYHRARGRSGEAYLHALPWGLAVAAGCVVVSRLAGFQPGYLYGVVIAVAFARQLAVDEHGHVVALSALTTLALGIAAWFVIVPVTHYETSHGLPVWVVLVHNLLAGLFSGALVGCVLGLLPLRFLPGAHLRAWSPRAWAATFTLCLFGLVQVLLRPHSGRPSHAPLVTTLALFVAFGVFSIGFRHYFARRATVAAGLPAPPLRATLAELVPRQRRPAAAGREHAGTRE